jgi:hypothetical protein
MVSTITYLDERVVNTVSTDDPVDKTFTERRIN